MRCSFVVFDVLSEDLLKMTAAEDKEPVQALPTSCPHEPFRERVRPDKGGDCTGVLITLVPSVQNTSSNEAVNFVARPGLGT